MAQELRTISTRLNTAHTALETAASSLHALKAEVADTSGLEYMERELHKLLGRLEALQAGLAHMQPDKRRRRSTNEAEGETSERGRRPAEGPRELR